MLGEKVMVFGHMLINVFRHVYNQYCVKQVILIILLLLMLNYTNLHMKTKVKIWIALFLLET